MSEQDAGGEVTEADLPPALRFTGDKTATILVGQVMGPSNTGEFRQVTDVWFDADEGVTYVEAETFVEVEPPPGANVRYYGGSARPPAPRERIEHTVRPR